MPDKAWARNLYARCYKSVKTECLVNNGEQIQIVGDNIPTGDGMSIMLNGRPVPEKLAHLKPPKLGKANPTTEHTPGDPFTLPDSFDEILAMFAHGGIGHITSRQGTPPSYTW